MSSYQYIWSPKFPLSGGVEQDIHPTMQNFFGAIDTASGDGRLEYKAFQVASYGRQLGYLNTLVDELTKDQTIDEATPLGRTLKKFRETNVRLKRLKDEDAAQIAQSVVEDLRWLKEHQPKEFDKVAQEVKKITK